MPLSLGFSPCYTITQSSVYSLCKFLLRDISVNSYLSRVKPQESQVQLLNNATLVLHFRKIIQLFGILNQPWFQIVIVVHF